MVDFSLWYIPILFFGGILLGFLRDKWICRNDNKVLPNHGVLSPKGFIFDHLSYKVKKGRKELYILLRNDETKEIVVYNTSDGKLLMTLIRKDSQGHFIDETVFVG